MTGLLIFSLGLFAEEIIVAAAANVQFVMEDLQTEFERQTGIEVKTVINSSGKLSAQISSGAPFDVFLSADMKYPETLFREGYADSIPRVYAFGSLVLWSMKDIDLSRGMEILAGKQIRKIAIANPLNAPYGLAAKEAMIHYQLYERVKEKLVFGRNVSQVNQYIVSGAAEAGFTSKSTMLSPGIKGQEVWIEIDSTAYSPIKQGAVILKHGRENHPEAAQGFYDFLFSETARQILKNYGYLLP
jgi:molybdate transport system substrate-binding protein